MNVLILPCFEESPQSHWYSWLAGVLEELGFKAKVLAMPDPWSPKLECWLDRLQQNVSAPQQTVVIGHSIGAITALFYSHALVSQSQVLAGLILLGASRDYGHSALASFRTNGLDFDVSSQGVREDVLIIQGQKDQHVPQSEAETLAKLLKAQLVLSKTDHLGRRGSHSTRYLPTDVLGAIVGYVKAVRRIANGGQ